MGKARQALKQVLETYGISQDRLAVALGSDCFALSKWIRDQQEPSSDIVVEITQALKLINPEAAKEFVRLYLGTIVDEVEEQ